MSLVTVPKPRMDPNTEADLAKLITHGHTPDSVTYDPKFEKLYHGLPEDHINIKKDWMIDVKAAEQAKTLGAAGKVDDAAKLKVFSDEFLTYYETYERVKRELEDTYLPYYSVTGASGDVATHYESVRRIGDLLPVVTGQMHNMEEYQAINLAESITMSARYNIEYPRKTSDLIKVQVEIADDVIPDNVRQAFTIGTAAMFSDATQFGVSMRDTKESKVNLMSEFMKELPGAFVKAKNDKVLKIINGIANSASNDQSDWTALATGGSFYTNKAAKDISAGERALKKYGGPIVMIMNDNTWQYYEDNTNTTTFGRTAGNVSTSPASMKAGTLVKNPSVRFYLDWGLTADTYVMVSQKNYLKKLQGPTIQTTVQEKNTPGQMERRFWFNYNKYVVTESNAVYRGYGMTS